MTVLVLNDFVFVCVSALSAAQWGQISSDLLQASVFNPLWGSGPPDYSVITTR